jgi:hypothetical protein
LAHNAEFATRDGERVARNANFEARDADEKFKIKNAKLKNDVALCWVGLRFKSLFWFMV